MAEQNQVVENTTGAEGEVANLVGRVKDLSRQVTLAGFGVVAKVEEVVAKVEVQGKTQLDKLVNAGQAVRGEQAANDSKVVLAAVGLVETLKVEAEKLKTEAEKLKTEGQKLFSDLVAAGEKRKAA